MGLWGIGTGVGSQRHVDAEYVSPGFQQCRVAHCHNVTCPVVHCGLQHNIGPDAGRLSGRNDQFCQGIAHYERVTKWLTGMGLAIMRLGSKKLSG